jgi:hypothetical protein
MKAKSDIPRDSWEIPVGGHHIVRHFGQLCSIARCRVSGSNKLVNKTAESRTVFSSRNEEKENKRKLQRRFMRKEKKRGTLRNQAPFLVIACVSSSFPALVGPWKRVEREKVVA